MRPTCRMRAKPRSYSNREVSSCECSWCWSRGKSATSRPQNWPSTRITNTLGNTLTASRPAAWGAANLTKNAAAAAGGAIVDANTEAYAPAGPYARAATTVRFANTAVAPRTLLPPPKTDGGVQKIQLPNLPFRCQKKVPKR